MYQFKIIQKKYYEDDMKNILGLPTPPKSIIHGSDQYFSFSDGHCGCDIKKHQFVDIIKAVFKVVKQTKRVEVCTAWDDGSLDIDKLVSEKISLSDFLSLSELQDNLKYRITDYSQFIYDTK